ncbi:NYN domain-containing protein [Sphaerisporangium sp. NPDC005288]|uniref:NYN domain-containing protein n=1 Tax=Sphaerisporangium sp. NPDC005288 TaxID=3155114 RepID=UPI0033AAE43A
MTSTLRLGVLYDGGWFMHLWQYVADDSKWKKKLSFGGIHDLMCWYLHKELGTPLADLSVTEAHYVLGKPAKTDYRLSGGSRRPVGVMSNTWDRVLRKEGIIRHDVACTDESGNGEAGADVELALLAYELTIARKIDVAILVTGDADFLPLIYRLQERDIRVIVPDGFTEADGAGHRVRSAPLLKRHADHAPSWESLLDSGISPDYRLRSPFTDPAGGASSERALDGYRYGTVDSWKGGAPYGFIRDTRGVAWFVNRDDLPPGLKSLRPGQQVRFNGRERCMPGRKYPQARSVEPCE